MKRTVTGGVKGGKGSIYPKDKVHPLGPKHLEIPDAMNTMAREGSIAEAHRLGCSRCGTSVKGVTWPLLCDKCKALYSEEMHALNSFYYIPGGMIGGVQHLLQGLKDVYPALNLNSEHLRQTPHRVARMLVELCWGLGKDVKVHLATSFEETKYKGLIASTHIPFTSLCCHHFAIFRGVAHVGYLPAKGVVGLSKLNRTVEILAARPQVQENLTYEIAEAINNALKPKGVIVVLEGSHDCISVRGVKSQGSITTTCDVRGLFLENDRGCKDEFLQYIELNRQKL